MISQTKSYTKGAKTEAAATETKPVVKEEEKK